MCPNQMGKKFKAGGNLFSLVEVPTVCLHCDSIRLVNPNAISAIDSRSNQSDASMATTLPSKRRKLGHGETSSYNGGSAPVGGQETSLLGEDENSSDEAAAAQPETTQSKPKRAQEDDDNAIYAGGLYKSSMFKLQVDEMLSEVQPKYEKRLTGVDDALRKLKGLIEGIESCDPVSVSSPKETWLPRS